LSICLVLGAGASLANAQHFRPLRMQHSLPPLDYTFFDKVQALKIAPQPELRHYAQRLGRGNPFLPNSNARMEEFFKDVFGDFQDLEEDAGVQAAYEQLVALYLRVMRDTTNWMTEDRYTGGPVGQLLAHAAEAHESVDVITFNHDLLIENEILKRARLSGKWCLERGYGTFSNVLQFQNVTGASASAATVFPTHTPTCQHSPGIRVLKLHGSLNWYIRMQGAHPSRRFLTGNAQRPPILCSRRRVVPTQLRWSKPKGKGRSRWLTWPTVVPPVQGKETLIRNLFREIWQDAEASLQDAHAVVFFGYSLPELDMSAERLFKRALGANSDLEWVDVINPAPASAARYASVARAIPVRWFHSLDSYFQRQPRC
jgi:hypothetical protein